MGKLIRIDKYSQINTTYYYKVSTDDFIAKPFYMGIDPKDRTITFSLTDKFTQLIKIVHLNKLEKTIIIPQIDVRLMWPAIGQANKAIVQNDFPEHLDYIA